MAKVANVFGDLEAFSFSVLLLHPGPQCRWQHLQTSRRTPQHKYSTRPASGSGLQILQQVFIADAGDLSRALWPSLPDISFLITVWIGSIIGLDIYLQSGWRWGYAIWTLIMLAAFLLLALCLFLNQRNALKLGTLPSSSRHRYGKTLEVPGSSRMSSPSLISEAFCSSVLHFFRTGGVSASSQQR